MRATHPRWRFGKGYRCSDYLAPDGPPEMETYDSKPDSPSAHRGDFKPIRRMDLA
ncbi:MAG: hypothetical protein VXB01_07830 [Opitutae bacterium]